MGIFSQREYFADVWLDYQGKKTLYYNLYSYCQTPIPGETWELTLLSRGNNNNNNNNNNNKNKKKKNNPHPI